MSNLRILDIKSSLDIAPSANLIGHLPPVTKIVSSIAS
jgi:hypothetical protein